MKDFNEFKSDILKKKVLVENRSKKRRKSLTVIVPILVAVIILPTVYMQLNQRNKDFVIGGVIPENIKTSSNDSDSNEDNPVVNFIISDVKNGNTITLENNKDADELSKLILDITKGESLTIEREVTFIERYKVLIPLENGSSETWFIDENGYMSASLGKPEKLFFNESMSTKIKKLIQKIFNNK